MKKILAVLTILFFAAAVSAQNSWSVVLHKKVLLIGKTGDEQKNVKLIRSSDWKKNGYLEIRFKEDQPSSWHHSLRFTDEAGNEHLVKDSCVTARISTSSLRKTFAGKKQVKIYMMIAPTDPMSMAPARRFHLATLQLP